MTALLGLLTGSKIGRYVAVALLAVTSFAVILLRAFMAGKAAERNKQARASLDNLRSRIKTDDEISTMPAADRRRRLAEWVSDGK